MNLRRIPLKGAHNLRDLGGYPTTDGQYTKWGLLYRSDSLAELTEDDWKVLEAKNIRTIIDLRTENEICAAGIDVPKRIEYHRISLMKTFGAAQSAASPGRDPKDPGLSIVASMVLDYGKTVFGNPAGFAEVLQVVSDGLSKGATVFMCSAGKDRTGMVAALLLYLAGVVEEDIIADYIVSNTYNTKGINKRFGTHDSMAGRSSVDIESFKHLLESKAETVIALLAEFKRRGIKEALGQNGFKEAQQMALKAALTKPAIRAE